MDAWLAGVFGLGIGVGLIIGVSVVRWVRDYVQRNIEKPGADRD
jgi:hypothetical protein